MVDDLLTAKIEAEVWHNFSTDSNFDQIIIVDAWKLSGFVIVSPGVTLELKRNARR